MVIMLLRGLLPRPERVIMVDTARERSAVWAYIEKYTRPALSEIGLNLEVVPHSWAYCDLFSHKGKLLLPTHSLGGKKRFPAYCSSEWKKRPYYRYLRSIGYGPKNPVSAWLGISYDELTRMRGSGCKWVENSFPLIENRVKREDLLNFCIEYGWDIPPRSSCWMCPNRDNQGWVDLKYDGTGDFNMAVRFERAISNGDNFLHHRGLPLSEAILKDGDSGIELMCESISCFT